MTTTGPNLGLVYGFIPGSTGWGVSGYTPGFQKLDSVVQLAVINHTLSTPPSAAVAGDRYIVSGSPTGAWSGHAKDLAVWDGDTAAWDFYTPTKGWLAYTLVSDQVVAYDNANAWTVLNYITDAPSDGTTYGRRNAAWTAISSGGGSAPSGATNSIQYNAGSGLFGGITLTDGQLVVGQTSAVPLARTIAGDFTLSAAGSATLATVNSNVGTFSNATITVNAKGLVTAASSGSSGGGGGGGSFRDAGTWSSSGAYSPFDVVQYTGKAYLCWAAVAAPSGIAFSIDGNVKSAKANSTTISGAITTVNNNDILFAVISNGGGTGGGATTAVSGAGLTWTALPSGSVGGNPAAFHPENLDVWYAKAATPVSSGVVTATIASTASNLNLFLFGMTGLDYTVPLDVNANSTKNIISATTGAQAVSGLSTTNPGDILIAIMGIEQFGATDISANVPSGYTLIQNATTNTGSLNELGIGYLSVALAQSSITVTWGAASGGSGNANTAMIVTALRQSGSPNQPPSADPTHWINGS